MRQIESNIGSRPVGRFRNRFQIKELACKIVDAAEQHQGRLPAMLPDDRLNILLPQQHFPRPWSHFNNSFFRGKTMPSHLTFYRVLVRRKSACLHYDLEPAGRRSVKTDHHQVEVGRQGIHHHNFFFFCPDDLSSLRQQEFMVMHPRHFPFKMTFHPVHAPLFQLPQQGFFHTFGLQTKRIAAEIDRLFFLNFGKIKPVPE